MYFIYIILRAFQTALYLHEPHLKPSQITSVGQFFISLLSSVKDAVAYKGYEYDYRFSINGSGKL